MKRCLFLYIFFCISVLQAQQTKTVDFKHVEALVLFNQFQVDTTLYNSYKVKFDILQPADSIYLDAVNMKFKHVAVNGKAVDFTNDGKKLIIHNNFKTNANQTLSFVFYTAPKKAMYFIGWNSNSKKQIWTQGQGKYTSNWLPSLDDTNDKIEFDITYVAPKGYEVIGNGKLVSKTENADYVLWEYDMQQPMSSYLVAVALGKYNKISETSKSGIPLEYYYYPEDSLKVEPTYRYTKAMFDFLENEIGYPYPWQNYKQVPVKDFLYSGMENTSLTIFSDAFVVDSTAFNDNNYVNVNAHELAHQWFGNLVTAISGEHHWLQEGFATYYALLAERKIFGDNYFYWKLYQSAQELAAQNIAKQSTSLLNPKASSLTFYQRGAWALFALRYKVGDEAFKSAVINYLNKYEFTNVKTQDFISEVEYTSGQNLSGFVATWLTPIDFPYEAALDLLKNNSYFIQEYEMVDCEAKNARCDYYLTSTISDEAKSKIIAQVPERVTKEVFKSSLEVRQAIAQHVTTIPQSLKFEYESLLTDKSYITVEAALYNLWVNFPEDRVTYLNKTKTIIGFNTKNVRQLWLVLALNTEDYSYFDKHMYFDELVSYTSSDFGFETRQLAFNYLKSLNLFNKQALLNLKEATVHHNWRFKKFVKDLVEVLSQNSDYKAILKAH